MSGSNQATTAVKVSVAMITYNQAAFIAQAIDSVLMQRTDFPVEIVIGDDCSTDDTRAILVAHQEQHPDRIRLLLHDHNLGLQGKNNFVSAFRSCRGEYVAVLEGDDFWTDPRKLQTQVEFLDSHPQCALCFHAALAQYQDTRTPARLLRPPARKATYTLEELLLHNFIPTLTVMFRNGLIEEFPPWYYAAALGDWPLHILNAHHGSIGYLDRCMATYRVHNTGAYSSISTLQRVETAVQMYRSIDHHLEDRYDPYVQWGLSAALLHLASLRLENKEYEQARKCVEQSWAAAPRGFRAQWFLRAARHSVAVLSRPLRARS